MPLNPLVLLTNDDGILAEGLVVLRAFVSRFADVEIVAPCVECSGASHAVSVRREMLFRRVERDGVFWGCALDGNPADCVKLAITRLLPRKPDLVIAGINPGANLGNNILYSGTVAAAREAAMLGVPAMAVSIQWRAERPDPPPYYETAAEFAARIALRAIEEGLPPGVILNVNVPNLRSEEIAGVAVSRQGATAYIDKMLPAGRDGDVRAYSNVGDEEIPSPPDAPDSDDLVLAEGKISVTPLHYDMTDHGFRSELVRWLREREARLEFGRGPA
jgi:5'-nucleotidase